MFRRYCASPFQDWHLPCALTGWHNVELRYRLTFAHMCAWGVCDPTSHLQEMLCVDRLSQCGAEVQQEPAGPDKHLQIFCDRCGAGADHIQQRGALQPDSVEGELSCCLPSMHSAQGDSLTLPVNIWAPSTGSNVNIVLHVRQTHDLHIASAWARFVQSECADQTYHPASCKQAANMKMQSPWVVCITFMVCNAM